MTVSPNHVVVPCNICGSASYKVIYEAQAGPAHTDSRTFRSSGDAPLTDRLVECRECGLQYVSPRLDAALILEEYSQGDDEAFVSQVAGRELTFARCLDVVEKQTGRARGRLFDVGTAGGSFLHVAAQRGWEVEGCEPNQWLCDWAAKHYGLTVQPGILDTGRYPAQSFDVVSLWDVLEHTPDPKDVIRQCHDLLKPGGLIVVNYPDIGSWAARIMGRSWVFLLSVHIYYFNRTTIRRLLSDSGFDVVKIRPHVQWLQLGYILKRASAYVGWPASMAGRVVTWLRLATMQVPYWVGQTLVIAKKRVS